jgi:hypothetical protein
MLTVSSGRLCDCLSKPLWPLSSVLSRMAPKLCCCVMTQVKTLKVRVGLCFSRNSRVITYKQAQEFSLTFDGCRAKVGDIQLEITEEFLSEATGLPLTGQKWFKNSKLEEVPWSLFVTSRKIQCCDKGMPLSLLKIDGMVYWQC